MKSSRELSDELLLALFNHAKHRENTWIKHRNISLSVASGKRGFEGLLLQRLVSRKLIDVRDEEERGFWAFPAASAIRRMSGIAQEYQISLDGLDYVSEELADPNSHIFKTSKNGLTTDVSLGPRVTVLPSGPTQSLPETKPSASPEQVAPASDRIVPLNHNEPDYVAVSQEFEKSKEAISQINVTQDQLEPRNNAQILLNSAAELWKSHELTYIQIKVGILLAVEQVADFAKETSAKLKISLLVEAIKHFLKSRDLDGMF